MINIFLFFETISVVLTTGGNKAVVSFYTNVLEILISLSLKRVVSFTDESSSTQLKMDNFYFFSARTIVAPQTASIENRYTL